MNQSSKKLFASALKHSDLIDDAWFHQGGLLHITPDNQRQIDELEKLRMAFPLDEENVQLSSPLLTLLERYANSTKRNRSTEEITALWEQLRFLLDDHAYLTKKNRHVDTDRLASEVHECALEIIEALDDKIHQFARYIDQQFSTVSDLTLRIRHNQRAISEAEKLNDLLQTCQINALPIPYQDAKLGKIFRSYLPTQLALCRKELVRILHSLRSQITKLQADSKLAKQLIAFKRHYELNPGFVAKPIPMTHKLPGILTQSTGAYRFGFADIHNESHTPVLLEAIAQVKQHIELKDAKNQPIDINEPDDSTPTPMDISELYEKSLVVINVAKSGVDISAASAFKDLNINTHYDHWLLALLNTLSGLDNDNRKHLQLTFDDEESALFNGNRIVKDILLSVA